MQLWISGRRSVMLLVYRKLLVTGIDGQSNLCMSVCVLLRQTEAVNRSC